VDPLGILDEASERSGETLALAARHLDPSLVDVLRIIGFDEEYVSARGSYLYDTAGRAYLDLHTGEGFASLGHNHPDVRAVLQAALGEDLLDGVQIHYSVLAGMLAQELSARLPGALDAVFFASTGAEAVDSAMKFARAATGRARFVSCRSSFHGVTLGPLSIVGDEFFKEGFGPLMGGCELVPFGDLESLEAQLRRGDVAAFVVEPIQGRTVAPAPVGYLRAAQELCRRYGTMFVLDEIQTGLGRTGRFFAHEHAGITPDVLTIAKALGGGTPIGAMATTAALAAVLTPGSHGTTFGGNPLAAAAAVAAVQALADPALLAHARAMGDHLKTQLERLASRHAAIRDVRGVGLMLAAELDRPGAAIVSRCLERGLLVNCTAERVLRFLPPLVITADEIDEGIAILDEALTA